MIDAEKEWLSCGREEERVSFTSMSTLNICNNLVKRYEW